MSAAISVLAADDTGSAAVLHGTFDQKNQWFLTKHLEELDGDVIIDCRGIESLDEASLAALREFCHRAAAEDRRVVIQSLPPDSWAALQSPLPPDA
jgi:anti-anti-sigma regulatory factor